MASSFPSILLPFPMRRFLLLLSVLIVATARADDAPPTVAVPVDSEVHLVLDVPVSTRTAKPGDTFSLHVAEALSADGRILIPAGAHAIGQVIHAQKAGAFGKAGELIVTVRYVEIDGRQIKLHKLVPRVGRDRTAAGTAVAAAVGPFGAFVRGGQIDLPVGSAMTSFLAGGPGATRVDLVAVGVAPAESASESAAPAPTPSSSSSQE
jgi:hypothetical protein